MSESSGHEGRPLPRDSGTFIPPGVEKLLRLLEDATSTPETPQEPAEEPSDNAWEVDALDYFKDRLDEIHESMVRAFSGVMAAQSESKSTLAEVQKTLTDVQAHLKALGSRSERRVAAEPTITVTLRGVPEEVASQLQAELDTRVERLLAAHAERQRR